MECTRTKKKCCREKGRQTLPFVPVDLLLIDFFFFFFGQIHLVGFRPAF